MVIEESKKLLEECATVSEEYETVERCVRVELAPALEQEVELSKDE